MLKHVAKIDKKLLIYETKHVWKSFHNFANRTEDENQSNNLIKPQIRNL